MVVPKHRCRELLRFNEIQWTWSTFHRNGRKAGRWTDQTHQPNEPFTRSSSSWVAKAHGYREWHGNQVGAQPLSAPFSLVQSSFTACCGVSWHISIRRWQSTNCRNDFLLVRRHPTDDPLRMALAQRGTSCEADSGHREMIPARQRQPAVAMFAEGFQNATDRNVPGGGFLCWILFGMERRRSPFDCGHVDCGHGVRPARRSSAKRGSSPLDVGGRVYRVYTMIGGWWFSGSAVCASEEVEGRMFEGLTPMSNGEGKSALT